MTTATGNEDIFSSSHIAEIASMTGDTGHTSLPAMSSEDNNYYYIMNTSLDTDLTSYTALMSPSSTTCNTALSMPETVTAKGSTDSLNSVIGELDGFSSFQTTQRSTFTPSPARTVILGRTRRFSITPEAPPELVVCGNFPNHHPVIKCRNCGMTIAEYRIARVKYLRVTSKPALKPRRSMQGNTSICLPASASRKSRMSFAGVQRQDSMTSVSSFMSLRNSPTQSSVRYQGRVPDFVDTTQLSLHESLRIQSEVRRQRRSMIIHESPSQLL